MSKTGWKPLLLVALCGAVGAVAAEPFTFVAWNVGHFSDGRKGTSTIATTNVPARRAAYRALFRELDAKVVGLVEYSPLFDAAGNVLTANAILDDYPHRLEGPVRGYHVNSVFLKDCDVLASRVVDYADHHQRTHHHDVRVRIGGHEALVSITHLEPDWPTDMRAKRAAQMRQLVDDLAKEPRVVIAGDFNIVDKAELQPLLDAGYTHVSAAMLPTWPAKKPDQPIDHIFVKGFRASDFRVIARPDLSDHCLVACSLEPCDPPCAAVVRIACGPSARQVVRTETRTVPLTPQGDGALRPEAIPPDAVWIDVVPPFMTARRGDPGYWMNGRGVWGAFTRDAGQNRWWRSQMPLFAVSRGDGLWGGHVKSWRFDYDLVVSAKGGRYEVFPRFRVDRVREYFAPYQDIVVDFSRHAGYVDFAKAYRRYQFARGLRPIRDRVRDFPDLAYLSGAMVIRLQTHGAKSIPEKPTDFTPETEWPINVYLPFDRATAFVEQIRAAGVKEAAIVSAGWNKGGYDHVATNLDCINYVSTEMKKLHDGKTAGLELADGVRPLWEIVYHGSILYNSDRFTQNHTRGGRTTRSRTRPATLTGWRAMASSIRRRRSRSPSSAGDRSSTPTSRRTFRRSSAPMTSSSRSSTSRRR